MNKGELINEVAKVVCVKKEAAVVIVDSGAWAMALPRNLP